MKQRKRNSKILIYMSRWPIFRKIFTGIVLLLLIGVVATTAVTVSVARARLYDHVRADIAVRASLQRDKVVLLLLQYVNFAQSVAVGDDFVAWAVRANAAYSTDPAAEVQELDQRWQAAPDSADMVRRILSPEFSDFVQQLCSSAAFTSRRVEVLVTDRYGAVVFTTYRPEHYDQSQADWWEAMHVAERPEVYIGVPMSSPSLDWQVVPVAVPLRVPEQSEPVGFVYVLFDSQPLHKIMDGWVVRDKVWGALVDANHNIIAGTEIRSLQEADINAAWFAFPVQRQIAHWYEVPFENGGMVLVGDAALADAEMGGGYTPLADLGWWVFVYQPVRRAYSSVRQVTTVGWGVGIFLLVLATTLGVWIARIASVPAVQMRQVVEQHAAGDQNITAWIYAEDELGQVAMGINRLLGEQKALQAAVAQRDAVQEQVQARRRRDIATTAAVGDVVSATSDIAELAQSAVELLRGRLNLYFVGLFLMNESQSRAILQTGTGEAGTALLARGYRVAVGTGLVGECVALREAQLDYNLAENETVKIPELPYARSEMAWPLRSRGEILGVLWALSYHADTFDDEMATVLQTIADQIAVAIDSIRLVRESEEANARLQRVYQDATRTAWTELTRTREMVGAGYEAQLTGVVRTLSASPDLWRTESRVAWEEARVTRGEVSVDDDVRHLALPITSRGEVIGVINVSKPVVFGDWTADELMQLEALTVQLGVALENARLYEDAQDRAMRQRLMSDVSSRIRRSLDVENVLQTAVQEMRAALGLEFAEVRLGVRLDGSDKHNG